jgi:hypothetical protein
MNAIRKHSLLAVSLFLFDAKNVPSENAAPEAGARADEAVLCAACGAAITSRTERTVRDDSFEHVFTNPGGYVYRIGCFRRAPGCLERGEPTDFFTWFPGYAWSFAVCRCCAVHLGWRFTGRADDFFGLILNHLKQS